MFSTGEAAIGCGHAMRTTYKGKRATAADYIVADRKRSNVTITCDVTVDKVIFEKGTDGLLEAKGVEYIDNDGNKFKAFARKEVVVSGGTYNSPTILMRSGIGPKEDLEALNIPVQVDLPGVGKNMQVSAKTDGEMRSSTYIISIGSSTHLHVLRAQRAWSYGRR